MTSAAKESNNGWYTPFWYFAFSGPGGVSNILCIDVRALGFDSVDDMKKDSGWKDLIKKTIKHQLGFIPSNV
jgi:hypothetical protein